jgi:hypothetical protein
MKPTNHDSLLAIGVSLVMAGLVLRGFARTARRDRARRKQHQLDERTSGGAELNRQLDRSPAWLERNLGRIANATLLAGCLATGAALLLT